MARRELKLGVDVAKAQMELFFDWYDIDFQEMYQAAKGSKDEATIKAVENKLIRAIRQGRVEIKGVTVGDEPSLQVFQHLDHEVLGKTEIIYEEVTGRARAAAKTVKDANDTARLYQFLGILSRDGASIFEKLRGADIGATDAIGFLFLMV